MAVIFTVMGRQQRKFLPCGVPMDPESCRCPYEKLPTPPPPEEGPDGRGGGGLTPAASNQLVEKPETDNIEIAILLDRLLNLFGLMIKKMELAASMHLLLRHPELPQILTKAEMKTVLDAFSPYSYIEPCHWPCSENTATERSSTSDEADDTNCNLETADPKIYRAIEILCGYPDIRKIVKALRPEQSVQARLLLQYLKFFLEINVAKIRMTPEQQKDRELYRRKIWRENDKAKKDIYVLAGQLDDQRKKHRQGLEKINALYRKDLAIVRRIEKKTSDEVKIATMKSERKQVLLYRSSEYKQNELRQDLYDTQLQLDAFHASNLRKEQEIRSKRFKIESQLLALLNKFDNEIGERQRQMEELTEEFEADRKEKENLEKEMEKQLEIFNGFVKEREEKIVGIFREKLWKFMRLRATKIIQRWWRQIYWRWRTKPKKKKKQKKKKK